ncbi:MAG: hypothetical protein ACXVX9_09420, partial [Mycobacteriaceae bacterium]
SIRRRRSRTLGSAACETLDVQWLHQVIQRVRLERAHCDTVARDAYPAPGQAPRDKKTGLFGPRK